MKIYSQRRFIPVFATIVITSLALTLWFGHHPQAVAQAETSDAEREPLTVLISELNEILDPDPLPAGDPMGSWDLTTSGNSIFRVSGWALDPDTDRPVTVRATAGDVSVEVETSEPRPEIGTEYPYYGENTGFFFPIEVPAGDYELCLTVVNVGAGKDLSLGCQSVMTTDSVSTQGYGLRDGEQPRSGAGTFTTTSLRTENNPDAEHNFPIAIRVEDGLKADVDEWAEYTLDILNDPRGWIMDGYYFTSNPDEATTNLVLASPDTVDELCYPHNTGGYTSCRRGNNVVINVDRWAFGAEPFMEAGGDLMTYHQYLINHEMGHGIGYGAHEFCGAPGELAPIMQQQTLDMQGCLPNGWPNPNG